MLRRPLLLLALVALVPGFALLASPLARAAPDGDAARDPEAEIRRLTRQLERLEKALSAASSEEAVSRQEKALAQARQRLVTALADRARPVPQAEPARRGEAAAQLRRLQEENRRLKVQVQQLEQRLRHLTAAVGRRDAGEPSKAEKSRKASRKRARGRKRGRRDRGADLERRVARLERVVRALADGARARPSRSDREMDFGPRRPPARAVRGAGARRTPEGERTMDAIRRLLDEANRRIRELEAAR